MNAQAVSIKNVLDPLVTQQLSRKSSETGRIAENWKRIVPKKALPHTRPAVLRNKILIVNVTNSAWLHELTLHKRDILRKIAEYAGKNAVNDIRFKIGAENIERRKPGISG